MEILGLDTRDMTGNKTAGGRTNGGSDLFSVLVQDAVNDQAAPPPVKSRPEPVTKSAGKEKPDPYVSDPKPAPSDTAAASGSQTDNIADSALSANANDSENQVVRKDGSDTENAETSEPEPAVGTVPSAVNTPAPTQQPAPSIVGALLTQSNAAAADPGSDSKAGTLTSGGALPSGSGELQAARGGDAGATLTSPANNTGKFADLAGQLPSNGALEDLVQATANAGNSGGETKSDNAGSAKSGQNGPANTAQAILDALATDSGKKLGNPIQNGGANPIEVSAEKSAPIRLATEPGKALGEAARNGQTVAVIADAERAKAEQSAPSRLNTAPGATLGEAAKNGVTADNLLARANSAETSLSTKTDAQAAAQPKATAGNASQSEALTSSNLPSAGAKATFDATLALTPATTGELSAPGTPSLPAGTFADTLQPHAGVNSMEQLSANMARASGPDASAQVAVQIHRSLAANRHQFSIRLVPAELGTVDVKLDFGKDGSVRASVSTEHVKTLEILQRDSHGLERALREAGVTTDKVSLNFNLQGEGKQGKGQQTNEGSTNNGNAVAADSNEQGLAQASAEQPAVRLNGLLDIHI